MLIVYEPVLNRRIFMAIVNGESYKFYDGYVLLSCCLFVFYHSNVYVQNEDVNVLWGDSL
jgi:hypothetical protein